MVGTGRDLNPINMPSVCEEGDTYWDLKLQNIKQLCIYSPSKLIICLYYCVVYSKPSNGSSVPYNNRGGSRIFEGRGLASCKKTWRLDEASHATCKYLHLNYSDYSCRKNMYCNLLTVIDAWSYACYCSCSIVILASSYHLTTYV